MDKYVLQLSKLSNMLCNNKKINIVNWREMNQKKRDPLYAKQTHFFGEIYKCDITHMILDPRVREDDNSLFGDQEPTQQMTSRL